MPNRIVREAILSSEAVAGLSWAEEVLYRRLMSIVDDYGRFEANPKLIRSRCYPLQTDEVKVDQISKWLENCQKAGIVCLYSSGGKNYLEISKFQQQTRTPSKCPAPDINCQQMISNEHLVVSVSVSEGVIDIPRKRGKQPKTDMPKDFAVSEAVNAWANEKGYVRLDEHLDSFKRKCAANGYQYANWDAAFMEAIRTDWAKLANGHSGTSAVQTKTVKQAMTPQETPLERALGHARQRMQRGDFGEGDTGLLAYQSEVKSITARFRE